ncbi:MAG: hypothetical protein EOM24_32875 [Chloroflexia bacterium]|nr:hypothetical protein [Chloroflexia bacterium]
MSRIPGCSSAGGALASGGEGVAGGLYRGSGGCAAGGAARSDPNPLWVALDAVLVLPVTT